MKRKYREAMRAADALRHYDERLTRFPPMPPSPMGEPWRPVMTEQQKHELEQYIKDNDLPF